MSPATWRVVKVSALGALLVGGCLAWRSPAVQHVVAHEQLASLRDRLGAPWWSPVAFVAVYAALTAFNISGLVLTLAGGVLFGFAWGVVVNSIGANLGANAAYALARTLGRDAVAGFLGTRFAQVQRFAQVGGFLWLLRLRLIPVVPFNLLNLAAGLAGVPWRTFLAATALGLVPGTVVYTLFADAVVTGSSEASRAAFTRLLVASGLLLLLTFAPGVARRLGWISAAP